MSTAAAAPAAELSITEALKLVGITHERDDRSVTDGGHKLYRDGEFIGRFTAHEACAFLHPASP